MNRAPIQWRRNRAVNQSHWRTQKFSTPPVIRVLFQWAFCTNSFLFSPKLDPRNDPVETTANCQSWKHHWKQRKKIDDSTIREKHHPRPWTGNRQTSTKLLNGMNSTTDANSTWLKNCNLRSRYSANSSADFPNSVFFISLIVDQKIDDSREKPGCFDHCPIWKPSLSRQIRFLVWINPSNFPSAIRRLTKRKRSWAKSGENTSPPATPRTKAKYRDQDDQIRAEISELLKRDGFSQ